MGYVLQPEHWDHPTILQCIQIELTSVGYQEEENLENLIIQVFEHLLCGKCLLYGKLFLEGKNGNFAVGPGVLFRDRDHSATQWACSID